MDDFIKFVAGIMKVSPELLEMGTEQGSIPQWDSLMQLRLVAELEERYEIEIPIEEVPDLKNLEAFYAYVSGERQ